MDGGIPSDDLWHGELTASTINLRARKIIGSEIEVKGNEQVEYDGELHSAANLYDAIKEGYYGKL